MATAALAMLVGCALRTSQSTHAGIAECAQDMGFAEWAMNHAEAPRRTVGFACSATDATHSLQALRLVAARLAAIGAEPTVGDVDNVAGIVSASVTSNLAPYAQWIAGRGNLSFLRVDEDTLARMDTPTLGVIGRGEHGHIDWLLPASATRDQLPGAGRGWLIGPLTEGRRRALPVLAEPIVMPNHVNRCATRLSDDGVSWWVGTEGANAMDYRCPDAQCGRVATALDGHLMSSWYEPGYVSSGLCYLTRRFGVRVSEPFAPVLAAVLAFGPLPDAAECRFLR